MNNKMKRELDLLNKKNLLIFGILVVVLIVFSIFFYLVFSEPSTPNLDDDGKEMTIFEEALYEEVTIDGILFKDVNIIDELDDEDKIFTVRVENTNEEAKYLDMISIGFYDQDEKEIVVVPFPAKVNLEPGTETVVTIFVQFTFKDVYKIDYELHAERAAVEPTPPPVVDPVEEEPKPASEDPMVN